MRHATTTALLAAVGVAAGFTVTQDYSRLRGTIRIDGSSTVFPITQAVGEEFEKLAANANVTVGVSGTGGGFKRFAAGETDISDASRPIKKAEMDAAKANNVEFIEVPVAYDGLSIVVNPENYWVESLTVDELKKIFLAESAAKTWNQVRREWPNTEIKIFAPGTDSGTFDYFKEVMDGQIRSDMQVSEDDNFIVNGIMGVENSIGFFGYAYYVQSKDDLKIVPIVDPETKGAVVPSSETIESGEYSPFSRPLFIYVNTDSLKRLEVKSFVDFYLENAADLAAEVGYVALPESIYERAAKNVKTRKTGTQFLNDKGEKVKGALAKVYK